MAGGRFARDVEPFAYLVAPLGATLLTLLGACLTFAPPTDAGDRVYWLAAFAVACGIAIAGTVWDRRISNRQKALEDAGRDGKLKLIHAQQRKLLAQHDAATESLRVRAERLADEIEHLMRSRYNTDSAPRVLLELANTDRHGEFLESVDAVGEYNNVTGFLFALHLGERAKALVLDLVQAGVADQNIINNAFLKPQHPAAIQPLGVHLRQVADALRRR